MKKHIIKYYPVGNGDTSLIKLDNNVTVVTDCRIREVADDIFDVKEDLLENLEKRSGIPYTDLFILTHPDNDHCGGFSKHYYKGAPGKYDNDKEDHADKIIIDEIWVTSYIFRDDLCDDATYLKEEVERRQKLYISGDPKRNDKGNRLVLIGYDEDAKFENVPAHIPGDVVTEINGNTLENFSFFIHGPFKKGLVDAQAISDRNASSIVYQARFLDENENFLCRAMHSGDADHNRWELIKSKSEEKSNEDSLAWDIFQAPHHCSWSFFNDTPQAENVTPKESSLEILDYMETNAKVVATCKEIKNNEDNPPHFKAKQEYVKKVGESNFINSHDHFEKHDLPIVFEINDFGHTLLKKSLASATGISGGTKTPSRAG